MTVNGPAIEPRATFNCLWCGREWTVRGPDDLEGYARLCPDCLGKAGDNPFLRFRLRSALEARAGVAVGSATGDEASTEVAPGDVGPSADHHRAMIDYYTARAAEYDDWYLRRGRYERGPIHDAAWNAELDAAGRWLDGLPLSGRIVELAAGTGWWSPLLASKGELWLYDAAEAPLERARERLLAHKLRAHIHVRDAWAAPEGEPADGLFAGFWLSHVARDRTGAFLEVASRWLRPGGRLAIIDSLPDPQSGAADHLPPSGDLAIRRLDDGREFTIVKVHRTAQEIEAALQMAGFEDVAVRSTGRFFVLATGVRRGAG
ncbi:MAG TPA: class I SAM-dependent methyltransferase [Candidatus Limnocylindrales bacterium]|nr:class I SAM-dependent methyltransferase [Candidatus Limnocylindrales bacterium]